MLNLKSLRSGAYFTNFCRTYISNEFKTILDTKLPNSDQSNKAAEINEIKSWLLGPHITSQFVVRNYVRNQRQNQLIELLQNRLESRICLDNYTGCYLLDHLIANNETAHAFEVAVDFCEEFTNELTANLAVKSILDRLNDTAFLTTLTAPVPADDKKEKKQRVGFLRNCPVKLDVNGKIEIGRALLALAHYTGDRTKPNVIFLGHLLCGDFADSAKALDTHVNQFFVDVLNCAAVVIGEVDEATLRSRITEELKRTTEHSYAFLNKEITAIAARAEGPLADAEVKNYAKWVEEQEQCIAASNQAAKHRALIEKSQNLFKELEAQKKLLWYFDNEEDIDLKIFNQQKTYPRKWFGKKKKPRTIDDNYIPPEVGRRTV